MFYKVLAAFVTVFLCQHLCLPPSFLPHLHTQQHLQRFVIINLSLERLHVSLFMHMQPCAWGTIHMCIPFGASEPQSVHVCKHSRKAVLIGASTAVVSRIVIKEKYFHFCGALSFTKKNDWPFQMLRWIHSHSHNEKPHLKQPKQLSAAFGQVCKGLKWAKLEALIIPTFFLLSLQCLYLLLNVTNYLCVSSFRVLQKNWTEMRR